MKIKSEQEEAIGKIEKITGYQLPNKFKITGLVLCIISIFSISIIAFSLENFKYNDVLDRIAKTVLVLGLLIISISKEKIEDELIAKIRMQSYNYAVIGTVIFYLIKPFINYAIVFVFSSAPRMEGSKDIGLLALLLTVQIFTFRSLKKAYNEE
jgi:succinate dehydrogenase hydrophobic anchor subunit